MKISVELTLSPLSDNYEEHIIHFITKLRDSGLIVKENALSTQVFGEFDTVMRVLQQEVGEVFRMMDAGLIHMKIVKSDRSGYEPHF